MGIRPVGRACPGDDAAAGAGRRAGMTGPADQAGSSAEQRAALAVIDMQRVFADRDSPWLVPRFAEIVGPIQRLVPAPPPRGIFTRFVAPARPPGAGRPHYRGLPLAPPPPRAPLSQVRG